MTQKMSSDKTDVGRTRTLAEPETIKAPPEQLTWQAGLRKWLEPEIKRRDTVTRVAPDWSAAENELARKLVAELTAGARPRHIRSGMATKVIAVVNSFLRIDSTKVGLFRKAHPEFFPPRFWDCVLDFTREETHSRLRTPSASPPSGSDGPVWAMDLLSPEQLSEGKEEPKKYGMSADDLGAMRAEFQKLKSIPLWTVWKHLLRQAWSRGFDIDELLWLPWTCTPIEHTSSPIPRLRLGKREFRLAPQWQFQDAVLGLAFQSWRAHFCAHCGEPFVADARQNKYCGVKCQGEATAAANLGRKMRYYDKNRKRINAKRRRKHRQSMAHKNIQTAERRRT